MDECRLTFYDISEFGFFKRGDDQPLFGSLDRILQDLQVWATPNQIGQTKTYDTGGGTLLPAYFLDLRQRGDVWLLTLWNETESTEGAVASVSAFSNVGENDVTLTELEDGAIPGFATYFLFFPRDMVVASLRIQHASSGRAQMQKYIQSFMRYFSSYALTEQDDQGAIQVLGYRESDEFPTVRSRARFKTDLKVRQAPFQELIASADRIRKIKKKATLSLLQRDDRAMWQRLLEQFHLTAPAQRPHSIDVFYQMEVAGLTAEEVRTMIGEWEDEDDDHDYGFMMVGDPETHWLGRAISKESFSADLAWLNPEIVNPEALLDAVVRNRALILRQIR